MRILLAEDHPLLALSIRDGLREEGFAVDHSADGGEALRLARSTPYDAIVLDVMLPTMDGWSILRALRGHENATPVLCLSSLGTVQDRVRGLSLGSDDYLIKPFNWEEFVARVRAVIRRGHARPSARICIDELEVDTARKQVCRAGERIELSAREYALLEYLAHRRDEVVSRPDIWDHLYDQNDRTTSNVVDVFIRYLRAKVDEPYGKKLIHTFRGQGYMLSAEI
jgi:DNA-binding response OmpR family regulator